MHGERSATYGAFVVKNCVVCVILFHMHVQDSLDRQNGTNMCRRLESKH